MQSFPFVPGSACRRGIEIISVLLAAALATSGVRASDPAVVTLRLGESFHATVTQSGPDRLSHVVLDASGPRLSLLARSSDGTELLRAGWRDGFAYGKLPVDGGGLTAVFNESFDCEAWIAEGWQERLDRIASGAYEELAARPPGDAPESNEIEAVSTAMVLRDLIGIACAVPDVGELPDANACYHDNRNSFTDCESCCERSDGLLTTSCRVVLAYACIAHSAWWCGPLIGPGCTGVVDLAATDCINRNCRGLPGDGTCPTPRPACAGLCMNFCGAGWDSACGACPGPDDESYQTACCT